MKLKTLTKQTLLATTLIAVGLTLSGCQSVGNSLFGPDLPTQCKEGIALVFSTVQQPPVAGSATSLNWVKAANLLTSAQLKQSQKNYSGCVQDVKQAETLLKLPANTTAPVAENNNRAGSVSTFVGSPAAGMPQVLAN